MSSFGVMTRTPLLAALLALLAIVAPARAQQDQPADGAAPAESTPAETDQETNTVYVLMETSKGKIYLALDHEHAPISVENFLMYTDEGTYDGTVFHRVIDSFMIQGGGFEPSGEKRPTKDPIKNEWNNGLKNKRGTIAMARTNVPDSATNQFFINVVNNPRLSMPISGAAGYAVFGKVVKGMDIVDEIRNVETTTKRGMRDWPVEDITIEKVRRLTPEEVEALEAELAHPAAQTDDAAANNG